MTKPSVILLGSKPAGVVALQILVERGWRVKHVVVAENSDLSWYGGRSFEDVASENKIPVSTQRELPRGSAADFVISYQFRNLVKPGVLALGERAALNFHAAPLPEFGGFAYYSIAILEDVSAYGVSCHHMDEDFDTGPLLAVRRFPIEARQETAHTLEAKAQDAVLRLFIDVCELAESGDDLPMEPQNESKSRYLRREQLLALKAIPRDADPETVDRYARAFWYPPYESAFLKHNGANVEVVPRIAREQFGAVLHEDDYERLRLVAKRHRPGDDA